MEESKNEFVVFEKRILIKNEKNIFEYKNVKKEI